MDLRLKIELKPDKTQNETESNRKVDFFLWFFLPQRARGQPGDCEIVSRPMEHDLCDRVILRNVAEGFTIRNSPTTTGISRILFRQKWPEQNTISCLT